MHVKYMQYHDIQVYHLNQWTAWLYYNLVSMEYSCDLRQIMENFL